MHRNKKTLKPKNFNAYETIETRPYNKISIKSSCLQKQRYNNNGQQQKMIQNLQKKNNPII